MDGEGCQRKIRWGFIMALIERRSGTDGRSESEKQAAGERRSGIERRSRLASPGLMPSNEQLALFARRLKRAMRDEKGRGFFGVACGEDHFIFYSEVIRLIDWIDRTTASEAEPAAGSTKTTVRKVVLE
jgi:hypothetical protein